MTAVTKPTSHSSSSSTHSFFKPQTFLGSLLSLPGAILFAILGAMGLARFSRQIVRVRPKAPGEVALVTHRNSKLRTEPHDVDEWIIKNTPSLDGTFTPAWWLPNGHMQTAYIVVGNFKNVDKVEYVRTMLRLPDGGTISIDITPPNHADLPDDTPTVVCCHGLTGSSNESYVRNVMSWTAKSKEQGGLGARGVVVNFRGCGNTPVTSPQLYSAAASSDLNSAAHYLRNRFPKSGMHGVGFSLGASVLANYLGEQGDRSLLSSGCALGCPWNISELSHALEDGWFSSRVYSAALGSNLLRLFFRAYNANPEMWQRDDSPVKDIIPDLYRLQRMGREVRLKMVDDVLVTRAGGPQPPWPFASAVDYYAYAGSHQLIHNVRVPLLGINAMDDPVVHGHALPIDEVKGSSHVHLAVTGAGGHLGWFDGPFTGPESKSRWVVKPIAEFLAAAARDLGPKGEVRTYQEGDFTWVDGPLFPPQTGADPTQVGWKVLLDGVPVEKFRRSTGDNDDDLVLQGL